ncbi:protein NETWORKED 4A [Mercurialis annua]|uniref:protein NETWORKED 4A n=1 Tax=Mercurialis annua TaxID=3986 RepID=UPI00215E7232|nr:protein NETWORKED 4A [Mercurialis annua]XP_055959985.1 protein NETWORKED 4A [Mercurialis annua]
MDPTISRVFNMIEQDAASLPNKAEICKLTRPHLIAEIEDFHSLYRSLALRSHHLNAELHKTLPPEFHLHDASTVPGTPTLTPEQKQPLHKTGHQAASMSSDSATSDISLKAGSDLSSSSSDSDSDSSGSAYYSMPVNTERKGLRQKVTELEAGPIMNIELQLAAEENSNSMFNEQENGKFEQLLGKIMRYEEELRGSKRKLQLSEEEVARLKGELEKSQPFTVIAETLQDQLELAHRDIRTRDADLEVERTKVVELQKGLADNTNELQGQLKSAEEEKNLLRSKLDSEFWQVVDLQEKIVKYKNDVSALDNEVKASKLALVDAQENFLAERAHLQSEISSLLERNTMMESRQREWELQGKSMEEKYRQIENEKMEMQLLYDGQRIGLQGEISELKEEIGNKNVHVENLNKNLDSLKFKYDMVMAEKDEMNAKVNQLIAEVSCKDNEMRQMHIENSNLIAGTECAEKTVGELRMRIVELEKEVEKQRCELFDGAEEKREAIRQLCFSLDHYRSGYREICRAFQIRHSVIAS